MDTDVHFSGLEERANDAPLGENDFLIAYGVSEFYMPRQQEWGPSVSINKTHGPAVQADGLICLEIEMQTGDTIKIVGKSFDFPKAQSIGR